MLAVKGRCTECKKPLSILNPGLVCFDCERYHHGTCIYPSKDFDAMVQLVFKKNGWYCAKCSPRASKDIYVRTDAQMVEVKKKVGIIIELRGVLIEIEETMSTIGKKCDNLKEQAEAQQAKNDVLKRKLELHQKFAGSEPADFNEWRQRRKLLGISEADAPKDKLPTERSLSPIEVPITDDEKPLRKKKNAPHFKTATLRRPGEFKTYVKDLKKYAATEHLGSGEKMFYWIFKKGWAAHLLLILVLVLFTIAGAIIFMLVEGAYESKLVNEVFKERQNVTKEGGGEQRLSSYYDYLMKKHEEYGNTGKLLIRGDDELNWSFMGSMFFCVVTYITIGYGDITPITDLGKILTIVYALVGIPLFLIILTTTGSNVLRFYVTLCENLENALAENLPLIKTSRYLFGFFYYSNNLFLLGALLFMVGETQWSYWQSLYFVLITLLLVGFGEDVPTNRGFMIGCIIYVLIGLALTSVGITLIMEKMQKNFNVASKKLGNAVEKYIDEKLLAASSADTKQTTSYKPSKGSKGSKGSKDTL